MLATSGQHRNWWPSAEDTETGTPSSSYYIRGEAHDRPPTEAVHGPRTRHPAADSLSSSHTSPGQTEEHARSWPEQAKPPWHQVVRILVVLETSSRNRLLSRIKPDFGIQLAYRFTICYAPKITEVEECEAGSEVSIRVVEVILRETLQEAVVEIQPDFCASGPRILVISSETREKKLGAPELERQVLNVPLELTGRLHFLLKDGTFFPVLSGFVTKRSRFYHSSGLRSKPKPSSTTRTSRQGSREEATQAEQMLNARQDTLSVSPSPGLEGAGGSVGSRNILPEAVKQSSQAQPGMPVDKKLNALLERMGLPAAGSLKTESRAVEDGNDASTSSAMLERFPLSPSSETVSSPNHLKGPPAASSPGSAAMRASFSTWIGGASAPGNAEIGVSSQRDVPTGNEVEETEGAGKLLSDRDRKHAALRAERAKFSEDDREGAAVTCVPHPGQNLTEGAPGGHTSHGQHNDFDFWMGILRPKSTDTGAGAEVNYSPPSHAPGSSQKLQEGRAPVRGEEPHRRSPKRSPRRGRRGSRDRDLAPKRPGAEGAGRLWSAEGALSGDLSLSKTKGSLKPLKLMQRPGSISQRADQAREESLSCSPEQDDMRWLDSYRGHEASDYDEPYTPVGEEKSGLKELEEAEPLEMKISSLSETRLNWKDIIPAQLSPKAYNPGSDAILDNMEPNGALTHRLAFGNEDLLYGAHDHSAGEDHISEEIPVEGAIDCAEEALQPQRRVFALPKQAFDKPKSPIHKRVHPKGRGRGPGQRTRRIMVPAPQVDTLDSSSHSEGEAPGASSGDEVGFQVPGKDIYYKKFAVSQADMEAATRRILEIYPNIAPTFLKLSLQAHAGNVEASLAFLKDAVQHSNNASLQILGLNQPKSQPAKPAFDLLSLAQDPTPSELIDSSRLLSSSGAQAPSRTTPAAPGREVGLQGVDQAVDQKTLESALAEMHFFDSPLLSEWNPRTPAERPAGGSVGGPLMPTTEDAVHLAGNQAEAMELAVRMASNVAAEKRRLRAEEDSIRKQWEYHMKLKNIFRDAAFQEAAKGNSELAQELRNKKHHHSALAGNLRQQCNDKAFQASNHGVRNTIKIDLHGMAVPEALQLIQKHADAIRDFNSHFVLQVVTGVGKHSHGGVAKLQPAVLNFLHQMNLPWQAEPNNQGQFNVIFVPK